MQTTSALLLILLFSGISLLHFYWALGGRWATKAVLPELPDRQATFKPGVAATLLVAAGLAAMALLVAAGQGWIGIRFLTPDKARYGYIALMLVFGLRAIGDFRYVGLFKRVRNTTFARNDNRYYTPLCILLVLLLLLLTFQ